ncbi:MAG: shikimate dehydrogenase [Acidimicrobiia bacterium]
MITGATRLAGVIGDPVRHSRSPAMFNAAFAAAGLDWVYVAFPVSAGRGRDAVAAMRWLDIAALNVTMPHKAEAAVSCDALVGDALVLGVANSVVLRPDGCIEGAVTDGDGLVRAVRELGGVLEDASVCVLGAGGAARAITLALGRAGAHVTVVAREVAAAQAVAAFAPGALGIAWADRDQAARESTLIVNATPIGMQGEPAPISVAALSAHTIVLDTVYSPAHTALVDAAQERGLVAANGLSMLVHQAALAFEFFTGVAAPLDVMRWAAADSHGS